MSLRQVSRILGGFLIGFSLTMLLPFFVSIYYRFYSGDVLYASIEIPMAFIWSILIGCALGGVLFYMGEKPTQLFYTREIIMLVILMWVISAFIGALPFMFSKTLDGMHDAYFESMSSLTTTGATAMYPKKFDKDGNNEAIKLSNTNFSPKDYYFYGTIDPIKDVKGNVIKTGLDAVARSVLLWRSFMAWLGGLGVVFLFVACFPLLGIGIRNIFQYDMFGPYVLGLAPKIRESVSRLWKIYIFLTCLCFILLKIFAPHVPYFDLACLSFSTISTGGIDVRNAGLAGYKSHGLEWILVFVMILGSLNFAMYYYLSRGKTYRLRNPEFFIFFITLFISAFILTFVVYGSVYVSPAGDSKGVVGFGQALREGLFHAVSNMTTTGYRLGSQVEWPWTGQLMMLTLAFVGGMVGSTTGGLKVSRHYLLFKSAFHRLILFFKPDKVKALKIEKTEVSPSFVQDILVLFWFVVIVNFVAAFVFAAEGLTLQAAIGTTGSMLTTTGVLFHTVGDITTTVFLSHFGKLFCCFLMLIGRLEYFIILIVFVPSFWKRA
ncbi:MAG: Trk system potassium uptake protein TrkH [Chlamydiae bacterium]|nr:Trk system potassium uptake protein TrkH [Chlamydiota bacterium]